MASNNETYKTERALTNYLSKGVLSQSRIRRYTLLSEYLFCLQSRHQQPL